MNRCFSLVTMNRCFSNRRFSHLLNQHEYHRNANGFWAYRDSVGNWAQFHDDCHFANTVDAGYEVAFFAMVPNTPIPEEIR